MPKAFLTAFATLLWAACSSIDPPGPPASGTSGGQTTSSNTTGGGTTTGGVTSAGSATGSRTTGGTSTSSTTGGSSSGGASTTCQEDGGTILLASHQNVPSEITTDGTWVYWASVSPVTAGGLIQKVSVCGGTPLPLGYFGDDSGGFAIDSTHAYWTDDEPNGAIVKAPLDGGDTTVLVSGQASPFGIALQSSVLYWSNYADGSHGSIEMLPLDAPNVDGGDIIDLALEQAGLTDLLTVFGDSICWATISGVTCRPTAEAGQPRNVAALSGPPLGLTMDADNVYWTTQDGEVDRVSIDGGSAIPLATNQDTPGAITVDPEFVYWADQGSGNILKVPIDGGAAILVSDGGFNPFGIAVDPSGIYWTNGGTGVFSNDGTVVRLVSN